LGFVTGGASVVGGVIGAIGAGAGGEDTGGTGDSAAAAGAARPGSNQLVSHARHLILRPVAPMAFSGTS
jgi:hypothetical protein